MRVLFAVAMVGLAAWAPRSGKHIVVQKDRKFNLTELTVAVGDTVVASLEAGTLITSIAFGADLVSSLNVWAKVKCVSKSPPGKSFCSCN